MLFMLRITAVHVEDYVAGLEECPSPIASACSQDVLSSSFFFFFEGNSSS